MAVRASERASDDWCDVMWEVTERRQQRQELGDISCEWCRKAKKLTEMHRCHSAIVNDFPPLTSTWRAPSFTLSQKRSTARSGCLYTTGQILVLFIFPLRNGSRPTERRNSRCKWTNRPLMKLLRTSTVKCNLLVNPLTPTVAIWVQL